jgi:hypothetical protein
MISLSRLIGLGVSSLLLTACATRAPQAPLPPPLSPPFPPPLSPFPPPLSPEPEPEPESEPDPEPESEPLSPSPFSSPLSELSSPELSPPESLLTVGSAAGGAPRATNGGNASFGVPRSAPFM